jgi:hypothetical protein
LPGLALNLDPPDFSLPNSLDSRHEPLVPSFKLIALIQKFGQTLEREKPPGKLEGILDTCQIYFNYTAFLDF